MTAVKDLTGNRYSRLLVLNRAGSSKNKKALWNCQCDCGKTKVVLSGGLINGSTTSCGCYNLEVLSARESPFKGKTNPHTLKHGMSKDANKLTPIYRAWQNMKTRCRNTKIKNAHRYALRGITYDPSWENFENFYKDMGDKPEGRSLDRIDNNKGYSKENCRWATPKEQRLNQERMNGKIPTSHELS